MKKKSSHILAVAFLGALGLTLGSLRAQPGPQAQPAPPPGNMPAPPAAGPGAPGSPLPPPMPPPRMMPPGGPRGQIPARPLRLSLPTSLRILTQTRMDLDRNTNDYEGHRLLALDACDKAIKELQTLQQLDAKLYPAPPPPPRAGLPPGAVPPPPASAPVPPPMTQPGPTPDVPKPQ